MLDNTSLDNSVSEYSSYESVTYGFNSILDIPFVFGLKQNYENFAKYELLRLYDNMAISTNIKALYSEV